jgi:hypothetical protein
MLAVESSRAKQPNHACPEERAGEHCLPFCWYDMLGSVAAAAAALRLSRSNSSSSKGALL